MKKLHQYLIRQFIGPFVTVLMVVLFALTLEFLWVYIDELVGKGLGLGVIFEFMGWAAATLMNLALPLATLLASIMTLGNLGERNELLAIKAAGISLWRALIPLIFVNAAICIGAFFAANNLMPTAYNKIYTMRQDIARTKDEIKIPTGTFYKGIDGYVLHIDSRDENGMMHSLVIYDHTDYNGNNNLTVADSGKIVITPDKKNIIFDLYSGNTYNETNSMSYRDTTMELDRVSFDYQQLIIPLENYSFTRSEEDQFGDEVRSRKLAQLTNDKDSIGILVDSIGVAQYKRLLSNINLTYIAQNDTTSERVFAEGFPLEAAYDSLTLEKENRAVQNAIENAEQAVGIIEGMSREYDRYMDSYRRTDVERYRKFSIALACLLFFFIGAPLGALIRKGGFGTPVIISVFFFLIYYVIDTVGIRLAKTGKLGPFEGVFLSAIVLIPIGVFLTRKSTQDSALFNMAAYKEFFTTAKKRIVKIYHRLMNRFIRKEGGKIRIVFMGTPEFAVAQLDTLVKSEYEIAAVVTVPDKPSGRGLSVNESAVKKYAVQHDIPVLQPVKLKDPQFLEQLRAFKANLFVVVAFRMLPEEVWSMPAYGTFNLHASLLPQYRGAAPINWAIINGERVSGVTTFMIDHQIDTGKILMQDVCSIEDYEDAGDLHDKLMNMGSKLILKTIDAIENHEIKAYEQESMNKNLKAAPKLTKELCHIDWSGNAKDIRNLIRGLSPYPAAFTFLVKGDKKEQLKIFESFAVESQDSNAAPGTISSDGKTYLEIKCGEGSLRIVNLQLAGKKRMDIKAFLLGFREPETFFCQ